jgi:hypothetical protein
MAKANFTTTPLMSGGVLVEGTDVTGKTGTTILLSDRWEMVQSVKRHEAAQAVFDTAVTEHFKALVDAAEVAAMVAHPQRTDWANVTISEGSEGSPAEVVALDPDGVILRLLEETDGSLLRWVGDDVLVAIA